MIVIEVKLWKTRIGAVSLEKNSAYAIFKYDEAFIRSGIQVAPMMMPLSTNSYQFKTLSIETFKGLPGLLADALPDRYGHALIDAWLLASGRSSDSFNILERLSYMGTRSMGALEFFPNLSIKNQKRIENIELDKLVAISNEILNSKTEFSVKDTNDINEIIKVGTSAGGARAKAIIAYNEKTGEIKSGQIDAGKDYTYWIIKLDGIESREAKSYTKIEYAYYLMAKACHIEMSESRLLEKDGYFHFMTKRFDRTFKKDGSMDKLHMQSLGALLHIDYNDPGVLSYEQAAQTMRKIGLKQSEIEEFFRRMVFNVMARNRDDHVKNTSLLMGRDGRWFLSPAYDITYAYDSNHKWMSKHQMLINGKREDIDKNDLIDTAKIMGIKESKASEIILEIKQALNNWEKFAVEAKLSNEEIESINENFIFLN